MIKNDRPAFSIIELIVALSVGMMILVPMAKTMDLIERLPGQSAAQFAAAGRGEEAIEAVNLIKNEAFACSCSADVCTGGICMRQSDGQSCVLPENFSSCWTDYPRDSVGQTEFMVSRSGGGWQLAPIPGGQEIIQTDPHIGRLIRIENAKRDSSGNLSSAGSPDPSSKFVTVTVEYENRGRLKSLDYQILLTAWENL